MEIIIGQEPFAETRYYSGEYLPVAEDDDNVFPFTIAVGFDENINNYTSIEIIWIENGKKPENSEEIEKQILEQFEKQ